MAAATTACLAYCIFGAVVLWSISYHIIWIEPFCIVILRAAPPPVSSPLLHSLSLIVISRHLHKHSIIFLWVHSFWFRANSEADSKLFNNNNNKNICLLAIQTSWWNTYIHFVFHVASFLNTRPTLSFQWIKMIRLLFCSHSIRNILNS